MNKELSDVVESIRSLEAGLAAASKDFQDLARAGGGARFGLEEGLSVPCLPDRGFTGKICAVDGGIVSEAFQSAELVLYRAVCVAFDYRDGKVAGNESRPAGLDGYETDWRESLDESEHGNAQRDSLTRLRAEIDRAAEAVGHFTPAMLFLDGGILPNPQDRPSKDSPASDDFEALLSSFRHLFASCQRHSCTLVGVVKDSRSRVFLDQLARMPGGGDGISRFYGAHAASLRRTNDSAFLSLALGADERTSAIPLDRRDLPRDLLANPAVTYLKAVEHDRPLRLEFADAAQVDAASNVICALCKGNQRYAYPAVLIEADLRAVMDPRELEVAYARMRAQLGFDSVSLRRMRRNERPFR